MPAGFVLFPFLFLLLLHPLYDSYLCRPFFSLFLAFGGKYFSPIYSINIFNLTLSPSLPLSLSLSLPSECSKLIFLARNASEKKNYCARAALMWEKQLSIPSCRRYQVFKEIANSQPSSCQQWQLEIMASNISNQRLIKRAAAPSDALILLAFYFCLLVVVPYKLLLV